MALLQAVVIGLMALIITPGYLFYFDVTPKVTVLLVGTAVASVWLPRAVKAERWFSALLALNFISLAISTALSARPELSLFGTNWRRFGLVEQGAVMLFAWLVSRTADVRAILRAVAISGIAAAAYGIAQYFGWDAFLPASAYHIGEGIWSIVRPPGTLGHASYFATWLLFGAFLSLALASMETRPVWRGIAFSAAALAVTAMLLTGTRAAMLGLVAGGAVWFWARGFRITRRMAVSAIAILLAGVGFYYSPPGANLRSRARWFAEDQSGGGRLDLWRDSLGMAQHRWAAGYGPEVFAAEFPRFESRELARAYPDFQHESPHNMFLDALDAQGIPGLVFLFGICGMGLMAAMRLGQPNGTWLAAALTAGIVSQQFTVFTVPTAVMFYTTIALAIRLAASPAEPRRRRPLAIAAAAVLLYCAVRFTVADHELALAKRSLESGNAGAAAAQYGCYERWRLPGTAADLWYSRAAMTLAQRTRNPVARLQALAQSEAAAERATHTAEDPFNAWYNLAEVYAVRGDAPYTERSLRSAIAASPYWFKPHWTLAQVLLLESRIDEAAKEATLAAELDGGKDPEVERTLQELRARQSPSLH